MWKKTTWLRLILTKVGLLNKNNQYVKIKITKNLEIKQIKINTIRQKKKKLLKFLINIINLILTLINLSILLFFER